MVTSMKKDTETAGNSRPLRKITLDTPYHNPQTQGPTAKLPGLFDAYKSSRLIARHADETMEDFRKHHQHLTHEQILRHRRTGEGSRASERRPKILSSQATPSERLGERSTVSGEESDNVDTVVEQTTYNMVTMEASDDSHGSVLVIGDPNSPVRLPIPTAPLHHFARKVAASAPAHEDVEINAVGIGTHAAIQVLETAILAYHLGIAALQAIAMLVLKPLLIDKGCWPNYETGICIWAMTHENDPVRDLTLVSLCLNTIVLKGKFGPPLGRLRHYDCLEEMWLLRLGFLMTTWLSPKMPVVERKIFHQVWHTRHAMGLQGRWEEMQDSVREIRGKYLFDNCFFSILEPGREGDIEYHLEQLADYHYLIGVPGSLETPKYTVNDEASSVEEKAALKAQAIENPKSPLKRAAESPNGARKMQKQAKKMQKKTKTTLEKDAKATETEPAIIKEESTEEDLPAAESLDGTKTTLDTSRSTTTIITAKGSINGVEKELQPHADYKADELVKETSTVNLLTTTIEVQPEASPKSVSAPDPEPDAGAESPPYISQTSIDMFRSGTFDARAFDESYRSSHDNSPYFKRYEIGSAPSVSAHHAWQIPESQRPKSMREDSYTLPADLANDPRYLYDNSPFFKRRDRDTLLLGEAGGEESQDALQTGRKTTWRQRLGLDRPKHAATVDGDAGDPHRVQEDLALSEHDPASEDDYDEAGNYKWAPTYKPDPEAQARWRAEWIRTGQDGILERRLAMYAAEEAKNTKK